MSLRAFATVGAVTLMACGGLLVGASPAAADTYTCKLSFTTTNPLPKWNTSASMKTSSTSVKAGQKVTVVINVGQYVNGPVTLGKNKLKPQGTVKLSGAQTGSFEVRGPAVGQVVGAQAKFNVPPMTGSFTASKAGTVNLTLDDVQFVYPGPPPVTTTCAAGGAGDSMGSVKVLSAGTSNTSSGGTSNTSSGGTSNTSSGGGNKSTGGNGNTSGDLAQTGPVSPSVLIAGLIAFQLGLVVYVRSRRALR